VGPEARVVGERPLTVGAQKKSFIGGLRYQGFGGARSNVSMPLARLTISGSRLELTPRGVLRRLLPEVKLECEDVVQVESGWGISRMGIRFVSRTDAIVFWARRRDRAAIASALEEAGFPTPRPKRAGSD